MVKRNPTENTHIFWVETDKNCWGAGRTTGGAESPLRALTEALDGVQWDQLDNHFEILLLGPVSSNWHCWIRACDFFEGSPNNLQIVPSKGYVTFWVINGVSVVGVPGPSPHYHCSLFLLILQVQKAPPYWALRFFNNNGCELLPVALFISLSEDWYSSAIIIGWSVCVWDFFLWTNIFSFLNWIHWSLAIYLSNLSSKSRKLPFKELTHDRFRSLWSFST